MVKDRREQRRIYHAEHRVERNACSSKRHKEHRDEELEYHKNYYKTHHEEILEKARIYSKINKDKIREYRKNNHDWIIQHQRQFREDNLEKCRESSRKWRKENKDKFREYRRKYNYRKLSAPGCGITAEQEQQIFMEYNYHCVYCGRGDVKLEIDHIEPLTQGGADDIENATACCRICNASKGSKTLLRFLYDRLQKG